MGVAFLNLIKDDDNNKQIKFNEKYTDVLAATIIIRVLDFVMYNIFDTLLYYTNLCVDSHYSHYYVFLQLQNNITFINKMYISHLLLFCYSMLIHCLNSLNFTKDVLYENTTQCNCNFTLNSSHITSTHIIGTYSRYDPNFGSNREHLWIYFPHNNTHSQKYLSQLLNVFTPDYKIRSFSTNTYSYLNNVQKIKGFFIVIVESKQLYILRDTQPTQILIYTVNITSNESIEQCIFTDTNTNLIILIRSRNGYYLKYVSFLIEPIFNMISSMAVNDKFIQELNVNISNNEVYLGKIEYNRVSHKIFIGFSRSLLCFHATVALGSCGLIRYQWTQWGQIDYSVSEKHNDYIAVMMNSTIIIYNFSTFGQRGQWKKRNNITLARSCESIKMHPPYLFISKYNIPTRVSSVHQLDLESGNFSNISELHSVFFDKMKYNVMMNLINDNQLVVYHRSSYGGLQFDMMPLVSFDYIQKTQVVPNNSFTYQIVQILNNSVVLKKVCTAVSIVLAFTSMTIIPQFIFPLIIFLDDLWFYKYHNTTYPTQAQMFMENVDLINKIRLMITTQKIVQSEYPSSSDNTTNEYDGQIVNIFGGGILQEVLNVTNMKVEIAISKTKNTRYRQYLKTNNLKEVPEWIYFMNSLADIQITQIIFNLSYYILLKFIQFLLFLFSRKFTIFRSIRKFFKQETRWWTLVLAIVDVNMTRLVFQCVLQIKVFFVFQPLDKAFFVGMNIILSFSLLYSIMFYSMVFLQQSKFRAKKEKRKTQKLKNLTIRIRDKLINGKSKSIKNYVTNNLDQRRDCLPSSALLKRSCTSAQSVYPYIYESQCIVFRNFLRSFFHAYLIDSYSFQIGCLFLTNIYACYCVLSNRKLHQNTLIFILFFLYYFVFGVFDLFFLIKRVFGTKVSNLIQIQGQFSFFSLCFLVADCLFINFVLIIEWLFKLIKTIWSYCCKAQIMNIDLIKGTIQGEQQKKQKKVKKLKLCIIKMEVNGEKQGRKEEKQRKMLFER